jgi:DNA-directed RNA polymerase specialized sigma24 family protein
MQKNNPTRFDVLLKLYYRPLFRFALRLCSSPAASMALTQRTFRQAFDFSRTLPVPKNTRAWLFTILFYQFLQNRPRRHGA